MKKSIIKLIVAFVIGLLFVGCTTKVQSEIQPYITQNTNSNSKSITVNFKQVVDKRDTKIVSTIYNEKKMEKEFKVNVDITTWYKKAFKRELESLNMYAHHNDAKIDLTINIKELKASYDKYSTKKDNMKANIYIELVAIKGDTTHTMAIKLNQSMYKAMILDAQGFETILNDMMVSSVSRAVKSIIFKFKN